MQGPLTGAPMMLYEEVNIAMSDNIACGSMHAAEVPCGATYTESTPV